VGRERVKKLLFFRIFFLKNSSMESQVYNAGSVSRSGGLVDLHLEVVVAELRVVLQLKLNRQILKKNPKIIFDFIQNYWRKQKFRFKLSLKHVSKSNESGILSQVVHFHLEALKLRRLTTLINQCKQNSTFILMNLIYYLKTP
jgi:hypothetical protein